VEGTIAIREVECFNLAGRYVMSRANPALTKEVRIPLAKGAALTEYQHLILRVTLVDGCRRYARLALRH
jgi:hypothetical protein